MVDRSHKRLRDILGAEIDFESPWDEDLVERIVSNQFEVAHMVDSSVDQTLKAQSNGIPTNGGATSVLTIDGITSGFFQRDDQYNTSYILVTSGPASGQGRQSRFPIDDSDESAQTFTCGQNNIGENLNTAGMIDNNTFEVIGHVHDGTDGEQIHVDDIEDLTDLGFVKYNETGQSQSQSRTNTNGNSIGNHTLILPIPAVDYLVTIECNVHALYNGTGITPTAGRATGLIVVNSVTKTKAELDISGSANAGLDIRNDNGSTVTVIAQNGQVVSAQAQITSPSTGTITAVAAFNIVAFQKLP